MAVIKICGLLLLAQMVNGVMQPYSTTLETTLRKSLFTDYEVLQRPAEQVSVKISLNLITVNGLDIKDQVLSTSGYFTMRWVDSRLDWSPNMTTYGNIRFIFSNDEYMWRPSIVIENSGTPASRTIINSEVVESNLTVTDGMHKPTEATGWKDPRLIWSHDFLNYGNIKYIFSNDISMWRPAVVIENSVSSLAVFSDEDALIRVIASGTAIWTPGGIFETSCDADVTYYPLDTQTCSIVLTTWAYTSNEIKLEFDTNAIIMDNFSPNGEWEVIETSTSMQTQEKKFDLNSYDKLYFTLKLKRRPLFHILNTILPVLLMASLIVFVFKLPPESGERVGMSLTVLLAYAVYLTLISDNIPRTSLSASILSTYLTIILMLSTLSVIFTIVVLDIYFNHSDDEEPPKWIQKFTRVFLVRMAMWKDPPKKSSTQIGQGCCKKQKVENFEGSGTVLTEKKLPIDKTAGETFTTKHVNSIMVKPTLDEELKEIESDDQDKQFSWKEVALILDRCFMYLFIFLVIICTVICLAILASGN